MVNSWGAAAVAVNEEHQSTLIDTNVKRCALSTVIGGCLAIRSAVLRETICRREQSRSGDDLKRVVSKFSSLQKTPKRPWKHRHLIYVEPFLQRPKSAAGAARCCVGCSMSFRRWSRCQVVPARSQCRASLLLHATGGSAAAVVGTVPCTYWTRQRLYAYYQV